MSLFSFYLENTQKIIKFVDLILNTSFHFQTLLALPEKLGHSNERFNHSDYQI